MQVTDEMVRVAVQAMKALEDKATEDPENIFGADLTSLARAAITAALAAMQDHVIVPREPSTVQVNAGVDADDMRTGFETVKHIYRAMIAAAPSQLSKRGDAERDSIQEA